MTSTPAASGFTYVPVSHPHIAVHEKRPPVRVADMHQPSFNGRFALLLTKSVGTMWCAYAFALLALIGFPWGGGTVTQYIQWVSQTFIQLTMLSVIMVGQNILGAASDKRAQDTWKDADATFHMAREIQSHLSVQDAHLAAQDARLTEIITRLEKAYPVAKLESQQSET